MRTRSQFKSERRTDRKRRKRGMTVSNRSIRVINEAEGKRNANVLRR